MRLLLLRPEQGNQGRRYKITVKIISKNNAHYTAVLEKNHLKCYLSEKFITNLAVRNMKEAQAIVDYWSIEQCSLYEAQRFYDLSQLYPNTQMKNMRFSADGKSILHEGSVITYDV